MIPSHKGLGVWRYSTGFLKNSAEFALKESKRLGDFFQINLPFYKIYITTNAEIVRHVLVDHSKNYNKGKVYWRELALALGNGLATSEGEFWLRQRQNIQPYYHKSAVAEYLDGMSTIANRFLDKLLPNDDEATLDVVPVFNEVTTEMTLRLLFGVAPPDNQLELYQKLINAQEFILKRAMFPWFKFLSVFNGSRRCFKKNVAHFDKFAYQCIRQNQQSRCPVSNVLTKLCLSKKADGSPALTDRQIRDEFITQIGAGGETSSACLAWTLYLLWKNPATLKRAREEADSVIPDNGAIDKKAFEKLVYANQVIKESLRLFPPGYAIVREAQKDDWIKGELVKKGSSIYIAVLGLHRNPAYFEHPEAFRPERFSPEQVKKIPKHAWIPFGAGPHLCVGVHFAMAELVVILALFLKRFHFELNRTEPIITLPLVTLRPHSGMTMTIKRRASLSKNSLH